MLADALRNHRGALSASLMESYGVRLASHDLTALELADLTFWLPDGCAFWRSVGGPRAWSQQTEMLSLVEFQLRNLQWQQQGKKNAKKPKRLDPPPYSADVSAQESRMSAKAAAWRSRQRD